MLRDAQASVFFSVSRLNQKRGPSLQDLTVLRQMQMDSNFSLFFLFFFPGLHVLTCATSGALVAPFLLLFASLFFGGGSGETTGTHFFPRPATMCVWFQDNWIAVIFSLPNWEHVVEKFQIAQQRNPENEWVVFILPGHWIRGSCCCNSEASPVK